MGAIIVSFLLFGLPFVVFPFGGNQFEIPKVIFAEALILVLLLLALLGKGENSFSPNKQQLILIAPIFLLSVYHLVGLGTDITFWGNAARMQGVFLLWQLLIFSILVPRFSLPKLKPQLCIFILILVFVSALLISNSNGRAIGTTGEPNALAAFTIFLWPWAAFADYSPKKHFKYARIFILALSFGILLLAASVSGLIAILIQVGLLLLLKMNFPLKKIVLVGMVVIFAAHVLPFFEKKPYENRLDVWGVALNAGLSNPILGGGFGNSEINMRKIIDSEQSNLMGYYVDSTHNVFLDWWVNAGIVGLIMLCIIIISTFKNLYKKKLIKELIIFFGLITCLSFNPASVVTLIAFWWIVGRGYSHRV